MLLSIPVSLTVNPDVKLFNQGVTVETKSVTVFVSVIVGTIPAPAVSS
jgi:hypothetical protein